MRGCREIITLWNSDGDNNYVRHIYPFMCRAVRDGAVVPFSNLYREPNVWDALSSIEKSQYFTLREGDLIAFGEKDDEVADEPGYRLNDILEKYVPRAFFIAEISDRSRARCGAHFYVRGG